MTCNKCGWVCFGVTREYAEAEVARFSAYFNTLSKEDQDEYYGGTKSSIKDYEYCGVCKNHYTNFRESLPGDCPEGCTISPIIKD